VCQTVLEAQVQEVRLLRAHKPPYNRRSTRPERAVWVKLTDEPFPRLSIVREVRTEAACYVGPFRSRAAAEAAVAAVHEAIPLRQCPTRLGKRPRGSACIVAELGRCGAPCEGRQSTDEYAGLVTQARELLTGNGHALFGRIADRMRELSAAHRYEEAATVRDRMEHLARGAARAQRLAPLAATAEVLAARRRDEGGWEFACVRYGRLAGAATSPRGADPLPFVEALRATAEIVAAPDGPIPAAIPEETELVLRWLESPGVRIVHLDGEWTCPVGGAGRIREELRVARLGA